MLDNPATEKQKSGLFPTPPRPKNLRDVELTENAESIFLKRYARRGADGTAIETVEDTFWRVAYHVAKVEDEWGEDVMESTRHFYDLLSEKRFFPNSPTFTGAGTPLGQLAACFVLPISDDMGKHGSGIFESLRDAALIQQTGGGNGFSFSRLRPRHSPVKRSAGQATGPVGFMRVYDQAFGEIAQGGTRRGANMAVLRIDHPDIEDFIACKTDEFAVTNFNISVGITDAFMQAVQADGDWDLRFHDLTDPRYKGFDGTMEEAEALGLPIRIHKTVKARELFQSIVDQAHHNGEPGLLFLDAANRQNPVPHLYDLEATNPCGEQWLGPYENCCLGSINLAQHLGADKTVDWEKLEESIVLSTRFLDDVVEGNAYVPSVPKLKVAAMNARRIGLGIMGLADLLYHVGIRYGSTAGQEFVGQVMEFVRFHSMKTSVQLAKERQPFSAIEGSIYDPENLAWTAPKPLRPFTRDYARPALDWTEIVDGIKENGIRNAAQTTVAPTGTIATVSGCEGYGCEPVFALAYIRHVDDNGEDLELTYTSPLFEQALEESGLNKKKRKKIIDEVISKGSLRDVEGLPKEIVKTFVVSSDITAEEHVRMQASLQAFVDNSLSKTVNFPADATAEDVARTYQLAWELNCKGITVYVTGSREKVVLETHATAKEKAPAPMQELAPMWDQTKEPRPRDLSGNTLSVNTPVGKAFVTINQTVENQPFEVFLNTAKAGSETAAISEAIGRLISYVLRIASPVSPRQRLREVYRQLKGIGGSRSYGFGPNRVSSLPDGVAQVLGDYLDATLKDSETLIRKKEKNGNGHGKDSANEPDHPVMDVQMIGDICPECGHASVINEEGCRKCYSCSYSEC
ncbi:MAG: adenosylcobalamin-dependent ribonucleoside-diphosphate reductase [Chloroflexi bacterium]|jgi:ribonucleoside-diphosphate reductase alpha chain|nr:adenosylcobalamin-dependent ribonucleoside-diphosphate reductase [Chloroflexota bacterium]MBT3669667.1 adenosylcobalamin-dependent ribonucleoside-diphosphate reductase [Chloroflexota bacterium]MBT4305082.1 adenosylcobalamin-dependent ribonucleoside-diphosphate reductase [Chloroflexota bacterium]MBT4533397.1 adenosylcobalamin-dependent ribonucleoside-diphosphate reductase [Chloroflexota bacterium]MBT4684194.1 adenosylcobalamin-dependent ribonucleoside-diphosphate reductase [Chloroflexota bact